MKFFKRFLKTKKNSFKRKKKPKGNNAKEESESEPAEVVHRCEEEESKPEPAEEELECISDTDSGQNDNEEYPIPISSDDGEDCEEPEVVVEKKENVSLEVVTLPTNEELKKEECDPLFRIKLMRRIKDFVRMLISEILMEDKLKRKEYVDQLIMDLSKYYGFSMFIVEEIMELLDVKETRELLQVDHTKMDTCLLVNTLKTKRKMVKEALLKQNINCKTIPWCNVGIVVFKGQKEPSTTQVYRDGHFTILKSSSSFLPIMALAPRKHQKIADMLPSGDRTSYIAALMKNTGTIYAKVTEERVRVMITLDLMRLGVTNTDLSTINAGESSTFLGNNIVDRVLLCAPSTETGCIGKDIFQKISKEDVEEMVNLQKKLLLEAIDMVDYKEKSGGYVVYTTMSLLVEENEAIINYGLQERDVRLVSTGINGRSGFIRYRENDFHPDIEKTRRFYPHVNNMNGMFVAKLKKNSDEKRT